MEPDGAAEQYGAAQEQLPEQAPQQPGWAQPAHWQPQEPVQQAWRQAEWRQPLGVRGQVRRRPRGGQKQQDAAGERQRPPDVPATQLQPAAVPRRQAGAAAQPLPLGAP